MAAYNIFNYLNSKKKLFQSRSDYPQYFCLKKAFSFIRVETKSYANCCKNNGI